MAARLDKEALARAARALERGEPVDAADAPHVVRALRMLLSLELYGEDVEELYGKRVLRPWAEKMLDGHAEMYDHRGELVLAAEVRLLRSQLTGQGVIPRMVDYLAAQSGSVSQATKLAAEMFGRDPGDIGSICRRDRRAAKKPKKRRGRPRNKT